jgi:hypothetical protein
MPVRLHEIIVRIRNALARRIAELQSLLYEAPIDLSKEEASRARFCFLGEFGYEMVSWLPYLLFLKEDVGIRMRTIGRPGSRVFYYFSDEHIELDPSYVGPVWGELASYKRVAQLFPDDIIVHPGKDPVNRRYIAIGGYEWRNKNIHARIDETHYRKPDYSFVPAFSPLPDKQIVVINNKCIRQWHYETPVNYFDRWALECLRDLLVKKGYGVVYNHFVELTTHDEYFEIDDRGIFGRDRNSYDMRELYASCADVAERNKLQIGLYNACSLVIGPQGGNVYLPVICRRPVFVLMRAGEYIDYLELARLYGVDIEVFYEPRHMMCWIESRLPSAGKMGVMAL